MENEKISSKRKQDHIDLAEKSVERFNDNRFYYDPLLRAMPTETEKTYDFLGFSLKAPLWVSSMTGGTEKARSINHNLAAACGKFGLGMGLGSCRSLLYDLNRLQDFDVKKLLRDQPLFVNLGIAQIETLVQEDHLHKVMDLIQLLHADGLIVHINPLQEWLQPEGDRIEIAPIETLKTLREFYKGLLIVKEVGQGFGKESIQSLFDLKVNAIEFGAFGGTNFSKLELLRQEGKAQFEPLINVGHTAEEMVDFCNALYSEENKNIHLIISGGIQHFLDGYYLCQKSKHPSIYGQAGVLLKNAVLGQEEVFNFISNEISAYRVCENYLSLKSKSLKD